MLTITETTQSLQFNENRTNSLLNEKWAKLEIWKEMKDFLEFNENELWYTNVVKRKVLSNT